MPRTQLAVPGAADSCVSEVLMERLEGEGKLERSKAVDTGGPPCGEAQADGVPCEELGGDCEDCDRAEPESREIYKARLAGKPDAG